MLLSLLQIGTLLGQVGGTMELLVILPILLKLMLAWIGMEGIKMVQSTRDITLFQRSSTKKI